MKEVIIKVFIIDVICIYMKEIDEQKVFCFFFENFLNCNVFFICIFYVC